MLHGHKNSKKQGDAGVGMAIAHYAIKGNTVCVPLTDSQGYDLVVDDGEWLLRVQVKTTTFKENGRYMVSLTTKGGNRSGKGKTTRFDNSKVDRLFVATPDGNYDIPAHFVTSKTNLSLNLDRYGVFKTA